MTTAEDSDMPGPVRPGPWTSSLSGMGSRTGRNPFLESRAKQRDTGTFHSRDLWARSPSPSEHDHDDINEKDDDKSRHRRHRSSRSDSDRSNDGDRKERKRQKKLEKRLKKEERRRKRLERCIATTSDTTDNHVSISHSIHHDEDEFGPAPPPKLLNTLTERSYGGALLPGEGSAIASYIQAGQRIPRRGEVGLSSEQIENYESLGYVMSGSRHRRMNEVRMRKENQVYSAEEKRQMALLSIEESQRKEAKLLADMRQFLEQKQKAAKSSLP